MAARPRISCLADDALVLRTSDGGIGRVEELRDKIRPCIGWLIREMNAPSNKQDLAVNDERCIEIGVDDILLRALGEIVRKSEITRI